MSIMSILKKKRVLVVSVLHSYQTVTYNIASGQRVTDFRSKEIHLLHTFSGKYIVVITLNVNSFCIQIKYDLFLRIQL